MDRRAQWGERKTNTLIGSTWDRTRACAGFWHGPTRLHAGFWHNPTSLAAVLLPADGPRGPRRARGLGCVGRVVVAGAEGGGGMGGARPTPPGRYDELGISVVDKQTFEQNCTNGQA